ncbi:MAG: type III-A CRISPR-associated RAMP protein Csm4 [Hungatella sp.]|nr:type III-A CRISPR-associated RAMP protein Csm4 [Hungatella sp.]
MKYEIYKLKFTTGVHFGNGMLNDSVYTFQADTLFSAMYIEALKAGLEGALYDMVCSGQLLFSDGFPYVGDLYMIPKPMLYIEPKDRGNSSDKKAFKKLKYLPVDKLDSFLAGNMELDDDPMKEFGHFNQRTMAAVRRPDETLPYQVGVFHYNENRGLYLMVGYQEPGQLELAEKLLKAVSFTGIGGKRSGGLGKFDFYKGGQDRRLKQRLEHAGTCQMLLSCALPKEEELENALEGASYLLEKRSGFVASDTYADELRKKKDLYVFSAGSCFKNSFQGSVYDVSEGGNHPVYRYGLSMFMGV